MNDKETMRQELAAARRRVAELTAALGAEAEGAGGDAAPAQGDPAPEDDRALLDAISRALSARSSSGARASPSST